MKNATKTGALFLLRLLLAWLYGASLLRYLCETLHLVWEAGWWSRILGFDSHGPYLLQFLSSPEQMANSFYHLENLVIDRLAYAADQELLHYMVTLPMETTLPFLLGLTVLLMSMLFLLVYGKRIVSDLWVLLHIVIISLPFLFREAPSFGSFFLLLAMVVAMIGSTAKASSRQERTGRPEYRYIGALLLVSITMLVASCLLPEKRFAKTTGWLKEQKQELTEWGEWAISRLEGENGRFPTWGKRYPDTDSALTVTLRWPGQEEDSRKNETMISRTSLYLKEYAAVHYGERGWEGYTPEEEARLTELAAHYQFTPEEWLLCAEHTFETGEIVRKNSVFLNLEGRYESMTEPKLLTTVEVKPLKKAKNRAFLLYGAPDFGLEEEYAPSPVSDLYLTGKGNRIPQEFTYPLLYYEQCRSWKQQQYSGWMFWPNGLNGWADYETLVYSTCLELPEGLSERFFQIVEEVEERADKLASRYPYAKESSLKIQALRMWFYEHAIYDTEPGRVPEGWNMVDYFLTESRRGYCVHFASSAVLLLRAMGIPARYAEGYLVKLPELYKQGEERKTLYTAWEDGTEVRVLEGTVTGESAHAWAEVWLDTIGFVPMEYTVGDGENGITDGVSEWEELLGRGGGTGSIGNGKQEEEETDPEADRPDQEWDLSEPELPEFQKPQEEKSDPKDTASAHAGGRQKTKLARIFLVVLLLAVLVAAGAGGVYIWKKERYRRMDNRDKVLYWYRKLDKLHLPDPPLKSANRVKRARRIAEKARFSDLEVSWEDVRLVEVCYLEQKAIKNVKKG